MPDTFDNQRLVFENLLQEIRHCKHCEEHLPLGANPVMTAAPTSRLIIIGQAPGTMVHHTGIPWNDKSGDRLRSWLQIDRKTFYDTNQIALVPMAFCYPGRGKSGDLPPPKACAPLWHAKLFEKMPNTQLKLLVGNYALRYYLKNTMKKTLTETVASFESYLPDYFPLPHPSPRNNIWLKKNPWFEQEVVPVLQKRVATLIV